MFTKSFSRIGRTYLRSQQISFNQQSQRQAYGLLSKQGIKSQTKFIFQESITNLQRILRISKPAYLVCLQNSISNGITSDNLNMEALLDEAEEETVCRNQVSQYAIS